jgi:hypothetical protein
MYQKDFLDLLTQECCKYTNINKCGDTQNLAASLLQGEDNDFNHVMGSFNVKKHNSKNTITKRYFSILDIDKTVTEMEHQSKRCGDLWISIEIGKLEHAFVVFFCDSSFFVFDSYIDNHGPELRPWSLFYI